MGMIWPCSSRNTDLSVDRVELSVRRAAGSKRHVEVPICHENEQDQTIESAERSIVTRVWPNSPPRPSVVGLYEWFTIFPVAMG